MHLTRAAFHVKVTTSVSSLLELVSQSRSIAGIPGTEEASKATSVGGMPHLEAAIWSIASASSLSSLCCAAACFSSAVPLQRRCSHCEMPVSLLLFFYPSNAAIGRPSSRACANSMQTHHNTRITAGHWHFDANVPCGRASAFSFAMLVLRCPASEHSHVFCLCLLSW